MSDEDVMIILLKQDSCGQPVHIYCHNIVTGARCPFYHGHNSEHYMLCAIRSNPFSYEERRKKILDIYLSMGYSKSRLLKELL